MSGTDNVFGSGDPFGTNDEPIKEATLKAPLTPKAAPKAKKQSDGVPRVKIVLLDSDDIPPGGLFLGVNGVGYILQPGVEVDVPEYLLDVLDHAVMTKAVVDNNKRVVGYKEVPRFSYRIVR